MLDLVPLRCSGRHVADRDRQPSSVGELLELPLPEPHAGSVASPAVRCDKQGPRLRVAAMSQSSPPLGDRSDGELGRVVANTDTDPPDVVGEVVNPVGRDFAQVFVDEVVDSDLLGVSSGTPFPAAILEVSDPTASVCGWTA